MLADIDEFKESRYEPSFVGGQLKSVRSTAPGFPYLRVPPGRNMRGLPPYVGAPRKIRKLVSQNPQYQTMAMLVYGLVAIGSSRSSASADTRRSP
jgi:hypothetical protein